MRTPPVLAVLVVAVLSLTAPDLHAEELVVGVKPAPPFVMVAEDGTPSGFSVDLVQEVARRMKPPRTVRFVVHDDLNTHLAAVAAGEVQMGIAATSITSERESRLDFSHPFFDDALDIASAPKPEGGASLWRAVLDSNVPNVLLMLLVFVLITAHVIWLAERGRGGLDSGYVPGVAQGVWWTIVTMSTVGYGDIVPKTGIGRLLAVVVIFAGIIVFGVAVASLTAAATAQKLEAGMDDTDGLRGKRVLAVEGSIAEREMRRRGITTKPTADTGTALEAIRSGGADAFVHDRSQLLYARQRGAHGWVLVDRPFVQQNYAAAFPLGSPLRKQVNIALQGLTEGEDAPYDRMKARYFPDR